MAKEYKRETMMKFRMQAQEMLKELPRFCTDYYNGRQLRLAESSQVTYLKRMQIFLEFLSERTGKPVKDFTYEDLKTVTPDDARDFISYILTRPGNSRYQTNSKMTAESYIAALSSYWSYFCKNRGFLNNPWLAIDRSKSKKKQIIYLDEESEEKFMNTVLYGFGLTDREIKFHEKTSLRDTCICQILLTTGIRVSELVGLDISDVDLKNCKLNIVTKGSKETAAYLPDSAMDTLYEYMHYRSTLLAKDEKALFVATQGQGKGKRISVRSVEKMVKKFSVAAETTQGSKITPHKLRATVAMNILDKTGNIALAKEVLNHESISTTQIYAKAKESDKINNRNLLNKN